MKQYNSYKPSGVEWIGDIPENWNFGKMKYVLSNNDGGVWGNDVDNEEEGNIVIRSTEITIDGNWDLSNPLKRLLTENEIIKSKLYEGDIVITKSSGSPQHIGKSVIVSKEIELLNCCYSNFVQRIRFRNYNPKLYHYILNSDIGRTQFKFLTTSSTGLGNLNGSSLNDVLLPFIPLHEQQQIVKYLDEKTSIIDKLISTKERKIELLKEQRSSLINEVITKGLDPNVKMKDSGVEWIGEIPESWRVGKLNFYSERIGDGLHSTPNYDDNGEFYFINGNNIKDGKVILTENTRKVNEIEFNNHFIKLSNSHTLLLSINGTIGNVSYYNDEKVILGKSVGYINLKKSSIDIDFLYWLLFSKSIQNYFQFELTGTTIYNLSLNSIRKTPILIPSSKEQQEIVEYLDKHTKEIDDLVHMEKKKIELLKEYRQSLISEVITGKIKVVE